MFQSNTIQAVVSAAIDAGLPDAVANNLRRTARLATAKARHANVVWLRERVQDLPADHIIHTALDALAGGKSDADIIAKQDAAKQRKAERLGRKAVARRAAAEREAAWREANPKAALYQDNLRGLTAAAHRACHIDHDEPSEKQVKYLAHLLAEVGVEVAALGYGTIHTSAVLTKQNASKMITRWKQATPAEEKAQ